MKYGSLMEFSNQKCLFSLEMGWAMDLEGELGCMRK